MPFSVILWDCSSSKLVIFRRYFVAAVIANYSCSCYVRKTGKLYYNYKLEIFRSRNSGTPTKRQVSKRSVSKRLKRQVYKTSGLQNVRFTKCQVYKSSDLQNVRSQKTSIYILCLWLVEIRRFCCSHIYKQRDGCVLFSILEGFLPNITIIASNK
jgi:hypothetical protein